MNLTTYSGEINAFEFHWRRFICIGTARRDYPCVSLGLILPHRDEDVDFWYAFGLTFGLWRDRYTILFGWDCTKEIDDGEPVL